MKDTEYEALRRWVERERSASSSRSGPHFSKALQVAVGKAANETTLGKDAFAQTVGVSSSSLARWRKRAGRAGKPGAVPSGQVSKSVSRTLRSVGVVTVGDLFVFVSKDRTRAKVLYHDGTGMCLFAKRMSPEMRCASWSVSS